MDSKPYPPNSVAITLDNKTNEVHSSARLPLTIKNIKYQLVINNIASINEQMNLSPDDQSSQLILIKNSIAQKTQQLNQLTADQKIMLKEVAQKGQELGNIFIHADQLTNKSLIMAKQIAQKDDKLGNIFIDADQLYERYVQNRNEMVEKRKQINNIFIGLDELTTQIDIMRKEIAQKTKQLSNIFNYAGTLSHLKKLMENKITVTIDKNGIFLIHVRNPYLRKSCQKLSNTRQQFPIIGKSSFSEFIQSQSQKRQNLKESQSSKQCVEQKQQNTPNYVFKKKSYHYEQINQTDKITQFQEKKLNMDLINIQSSLEGQFLTQAGQQAKVNLIGEDKFAKNVIRSIEQKIETKSVDQDKNRDKTEVKITEKESKSQQ